MPWVVHLLIHTRWLPTSNRESLRRSWKLHMECPINAQWPSATGWTHCSLVCDNRVMQWSWEASRRGQRCAFIAVGFEEVFMRIPKDSEISWKLMKVTESGIDSRGSLQETFYFEVRITFTFFSYKSICWHKQTESKFQRQFKHIQTLINIRWALPQLPGRIWQCRCACWPPTSWVTGSSALWCLSCHSMQHG